MPGRNHEKMYGNIFRSYGQLLYSCYNGQRGRIVRHFSYLIHYFDLICYMIIYQSKCVLRRKRFDIHLLTKMSDMTRRFEVIMTSFSSDKCNRQVQV